MPEEMTLGGLNLDNTAELYLRAACVLGVEETHVSTAAHSLDGQYPEVSALRFILDHGLFYATISPLDEMLLRCGGVEGLNHLRELWRAQGVPQSYIDANAEHFLTYLVAKHTAYFTALQEYPTTHSLYVNRRASRNDIDAALAKGAVALVELRDEETNPTLTLPILIERR